MNMADNKEKTAGELLAEQLVYKPENNGALMEDSEIAWAFDFSEDYKAFLDAAKTEREVVDYTIKLLEQRGYAPFDAATRYRPGDRVYLNNRGKALIFAAVGTRPLEEGVRILASHIDSPRLDLKPRPLYEEAQLALLKTHYYGGIRKYQWSAIPLALHGTVVKKDGASIPVRLGEDEDDMAEVIDNVEEEEP